MDSLTLEQMLLWQKDTNNYVKNDAESNKRPNELIIASSTDELNIRVNEKLDILPIIDQDGIVCLNFIPDEMFFMLETVFQSLHTWI